MKKSRAVAMKLMDEWENEKFYQEADLINYSIIRPLVCCFLCYHCSDNETSYCSDCSDDFTCPEKIKKDEVKVYEKE